MSKQANDMKTYPYPYTPKEIQDMYPLSELKKKSLPVLRLILIYKLKGKPPYGDQTERQNWIDAITDMKHPPPGIYIEQAHWHPGKVSNSDTKTHVLD
jgi:hypothetical protein